jgi:hypothetical protein
MLFDGGRELQEDQDLGYVLGWFCGGFLIVGVIVGAIAVNKGRKRRAFQAFVQPVATIAAFFVLLLLWAGLETLTGPWRTKSAQETATVTLLLGTVASPLLIQYLLQKMKWPQVS